VSIHTDTPGLRSVFRDLNSKWLFSVLSFMLMVAFLPQPAPATTYSSIYVYAFRGNASKDFWQYDIATDTWTSLTDAPDNVKAGGALTFDGTYVYGLRGDDHKDFWKYDIAGNTWTSLADAPDRVKEGGALTFDGAYVYALRGKNQKHFWKYDIAGDKWTSLADAPDRVKEGGALAIGWSRPLMVSNHSGASGITAFSANLNGDLVSASAGTAAAVHIYWGPTDGVTNVLNWTNRIDTGQIGVGNFSFNISGLNAATPYYYRCYATNAYGHVWATSTTNFITSAWSADSDGDNVIDFNEYLAQSDPADADSFMRILSAEPAGPADVRLTVWLGTNRTFTILAADAVNTTKTAIATVTANSNGTYYWTDTNAVNETGQRFYSISVTHDGSGYTNTEQWAMFVQSREDNTKYLISVPVDPGTNNNLNSEIGQQLARGLHPGSSTNDSDMLSYLTASNTWSEFFLVTNQVGVAYWWDPTTGQPADATITAGMGLWVERKNGSGPATPNCVFLGRIFTNMPPITFRTAHGGWTVFGWPLAGPRRHRNTESNGKYSTPRNQLGFADVGTGGKTINPKRAGERGDQIWIWKDNTWKKCYWLMDHIGTNWDRRWWDSRAGDFADFALEPGMAYYYRHSTNWNGTDFEWSPDVD